MAATDYSADFPVCCIADFAIGRAAIILFILVTAVFVRTASFGFVNYDDPQYVYENPRVANGISVGNVGWAFTSLHGGVSYWHPLTWISHQLDCQLFGLRAGTHHLTNVWLHVANTLLLLALLTRLGFPAALAFFGAGLFGLHPLHVESVAWVAERKDVLCAGFYLSAWLTYLRHRERPSLGCYLLSLALFGFALMAKPMAVTLPGVLALQEIFAPSWRKQWFPRLFRLAPFFALSVGAAWITCLGQAKVGAMQNSALLPFDDRFANAIVAYATYLRKFIAPYDLCAIYLHPGRRALGIVVFAALVLGCVTWLAWRARRKHPAVLFGWLFFLGTLLPAIGLIQVGVQAMADRYTYIPLTGLIIMMTSGLAGRLRWPMVEHCGWATPGGSPGDWPLISVGQDRAPQPQGAINVSRPPSHFALRPSPICESCSVARVPGPDCSPTVSQPARSISLWRSSALLTVLAVCGLLSFCQLEFWRNSILLYENVLRVEPDNWVARLGLAMALTERRQFDAAQVQLEQALAKNQNAAEVHKKYGVFLSWKGDPAGALRHWQTALALNPDQAGLWFLLANLYAACADPALRNGSLAMHCAAQGRRLKDTCEPSDLLIMAAACAEARDFPAALRWLDQALSQAKSMRDQPLLTEVLKRRSFYQRGEIP